MCVVSCSSFVILLFFVHSLSPRQSHASSATTSLPSYFEVQDPHPDDPYHFLLRNGLNPTASSSSTSLPNTNINQPGEKEKEKARVSLTGTGISTPMLEADVVEDADASTILPPPRRQPHPLSLSQLSYELEHTSISASSSPTTASTIAPSLSSPTERETKARPGLGMGLIDKYPDADSKTLEQLRRFTQLIGGRVSVDGELPPVYRSVAAGSGAGAGGASGNTK